MKHISGIYKITNLINGKLYIGSSVDLKSREHTHFCKLRKISTLINICRVLITKMVVKTLALK